MGYSSSAGGPHGACQMQGRGSRGQGVWRGPGSLLGSQVCMEVETTGDLRGQPEVQWEAVGEGAGVGPGRCRAGLLRGWCMCQSLARVCPPRLPSSHFALTGTGGNAALFPPSLLPSVCAWGSGGPALILLHTDISPPHVFIPRLHISEIS